MKESPITGPTYYVRHPDDSYSVADPQPQLISSPQQAASPDSVVVPRESAELVEAKRLLAKFALGYDTFNEPETCLNWSEVEALVKETRAFLTAAPKGDKHD